MKDKKLFEAAETDSGLEALYWLCSESESFQNPNLMPVYEQLHRYILLKYIKILGVF